MTPPKNVAAAVLNRSPQKDWRYMEGHTADSESATDPAKTPPPG